MAVARVIAVVGKERWRGALQLGRAPCGVHDLVTYQDARFGGRHALADGGKDSDAVFVGPVVSDGGLLLSV